MVDLEVIDIISYVDDIVVVHDGGGGGDNQKSGTCIELQLEGCWVRVVVHALW